MVSSLQLFIYFRKRRVPIEYLNSLFRVVFGEVLQTTQLFMRDITIVEPHWLEELAPHYFQKTTER